MLRLLLIEARQKAMKNVFAGRKLTIATMHGKEQVIGPILCEATGVVIEVAEGFNTDIFGTFTGEVEREADALTVARRKCLAAAAMTETTLVLASEGSFGPHPTIPFAKCDDEVLVLLDLYLGLEIKVREISTKTNFSGKTVRSLDDAKAFAANAIFPSHGLIVGRSRGETQGLKKGIRDTGEFERLVKENLDTFGECYVETDMRAMHNPTRMGVIATASEKLAQSMLRTCPVCNTPGFDVEDVLSGLPCEQCATPTAGTLSFVYGCQRCGHREESKFPHGRKTESAMYCDWCNP